MSLREILSRTPMGHLTAPWLRARPSVLAVQPVRWLEAMPIASLQWTAISVLGGVRTGQTFPLRISTRTVATHKQYRVNLSRRQTSKQRSTKTQKLVRLDIG